MKPSIQNTLLRAAVAVSAAFLVLCAPEAQADDRVVWHFKGRIDGTERIEVTAESVQWRHVSWSWPPEPVTLNGVEWKPQSQPRLRTNDLSGPVDFATARLELIRGRDAVALERSATGITLFISDTPCGTDVYEFRIVFEPQSAKPPALAEPSMVLHIRAVVDGSDRLLVTQREAMWIHRHWGWPTEVTLNGVLWKPSECDRLTNSGRTTFLPWSVDFGSASIVSRKGRDLIAVEPVPSGLLIHFADNPNGTSTYEVKIRLGSSLPEPPYAVSSRPVRRTDVPSPSPLSTRPKHRTETRLAAPSSGAVRPPATHRPDVAAVSAIPKDVDPIRVQPLAPALTNQTVVKVHRPGCGSATLDSTPWVAGERVVVSGDNAPPSSDGVLLVSFVPPAHGTLYGCQIYIALDALVGIIPIRTDAAGGWTLVGRVPSEASSLRLPLAMQAAFAHFGASELETTNGLHVTVRAVRDEPRAASVRSAATPGPKR